MFSSLTSNGHFSKGLALLYSHAAVRGNRNTRLMRSDFQDNILEMALTPYFLLYFWLATRLPPEKCEFMENKTGLCLGSQASLSCEIEVCPKGSHVGSWLSVEDTDAQNSPLSPAPTSSRSSAALSPPSPPPPSAPSYLLFRPSVCGQITHSHGSSVSQTFGKHRNYLGVGGAY